MQIVSNKLVMESFLEKCTKIYLKISFSAAIFVLSIQTYSTVNFDFGNMILLSK